MKTSSIKAYYVKLKKCIKIKLSFSEAENFFKDKELSPAEYLQYKDLLKHNMSKKSYDKLFQCLQRKEGSCVYTFVKETEH